MSDEVRIGIIICDRYRMCAGGKCLRALKNREGAFSIYKDILLQDWSLDIHHALV